MEFKEASELKKLNDHLIGKTYKGEIIDDLVVAPIAPNEWSNFLKAYIYFDYDGVRAISSYVNSDLHVVALFGKYMDDGVLAFEPLDKLLNSLKSK